MTDLAPQLVVHLLESTAWSLMLVGFMALARIQSAHIRCFLYRVCLLKFVVPSSAVFAWLAMREGTEALALVKVVAEPAQGLAISSANWTYSYAILALWLIGVAGFLMARTIQLVRFHRRLDPPGEPFAGRERQVLQAALASVGRSGDYVRGYIEESGPIIGLYGVFRPRIIARRAFLEVLDDEELRLALQHEIAHRTRRDSLWGIAVEVVACSLWFHPQVWFLKKRIQLEVEKACDEQVVSMAGKWKEYASCLFKAAEFSIHKQVFGAVALSGTSLKRRVQNVTEYKKMKLSKKRLARMGVMALSFLAAAFTLSVVADTASDEKVYNLSELDKKPSAIVFSEPVYPKELHDEGVSASVVVEFVLTAEAEVRSAKVYKEEKGYPAFGVAAVDAVRRSTWNPGIKDGKPVAARVRVQINFKP